MAMVDVTVKEETMDYKFGGSSGIEESNGDTPQPKGSCSATLQTTRNERSQPYSTFEQILTKKEMQVEPLELLQKQNSASQRCQDDVENPENENNYPEVFNIQEEVEITIDNVKIEDADTWTNESSTLEKAMEEEPNDPLTKGEMESSENKFVEEIDVFNIQEEVEITLEDVKIEAYSKENMKKTKRVIVCRYCDKVFSKKSNCMRHIKAVHKLNACGEKIDKEQIKLNCEFCDKQFASKYSLQNHRESKHFPDQSNQKLLKCDKCNYSTRQKYNLQRHMKQHEKNHVCCSFCDAKCSSKTGLRRHEQKVHNSRTRTIIRLKKICPLCNFTSANKKLSEMYSHFENTHKIQLQWEDHNFLSRIDFLKWKEQVEISTTSSFVKFDTYNNKETYRCHRCGTNRSKGLKKRNTTRKSCKIGGFCPARMIVKVKKDEGINVSFLKTHVGHENELKYKRLTKEERKMIADKISLKIPVKQILKDVRSSVTSNSDLQRIHLINRKDIQNIRKSFNLVDDNPVDISDNNYDSFYSDETDRLAETNVTVNEVVSEHKKDMQIFEDSLENFVNDVARNITNMEELNLAKEHFASLKPTLEAMRTTIAIETATEIKKLPPKRKKVQQRRSVSTKTHQNCENSSQDIEKVILDLLQNS